MTPLSTMPVIGPAARWFFERRVWRVYLHLSGHKWSRLAAAITFTSFLALFPMLALGAALGAALLPPARMRDLQNSLADQVPGIAHQLDLQGFVDDAGTVGVIAAVLLLVTGVRWAGTLRESLRALWDLEEDPGNPVLLRLKDLGTLVGLGVVGLVSLAGSAFAVTAVSWVAERIGLAEGGIGTALLRLAGYGAAVAADFALLWYVLTVLPGVRPPRRATVVACLIGAVGFEVLKALLGGYLQGVAAKSMYGAFGVPVALLLWISFMTKLMLFCAAWTATQRTEKPIEQIDALGSGAPDPGGSERAAGHEDEPASEDQPGENGPENEDDARPPGDASAPGKASPSPEVTPPKDRRPANGDAGGAPGRAAATGGARRTPPPPAAPENRP